MRVAASLTFLALALPSLASLNDRHVSLRKRTVETAAVEERAQEDFSEVSTFDARADGIFDLEDRDIHGEDESDILAKRAVTCPSGYKYRIIKEDFSKAAYNTSLWVMDLGDKKGLSWDKTGKSLRIAVTQNNNNTVFRSKLSWLPGSSFTVVTRPANISGIVSPYIFLSASGQSSDEVDLEFVGGDPKSIQTVVWQKAARVIYNVDSFNNFNTQASTGTYKLNWNAQDVQLYVGNQLSRTMKRTGSAWALDALPFKWGPWAAPNSPGWAGALDWKANPVAYVYVKAIKVSGCSK